jgi:isoleucyl-tRNA synthetase
MRGDAIVSAMGGWDCHGLPVELEVEKRHGLKSKKEIESYGVERFCDECRESTLSVAALWVEMSRRLGYWLDYQHAYRTMDAEYIESVWWSLRQFFDKGLLEKGFYVLPYCPRCETPLSSHEVAQGYGEAVDPSVTVRFRVRRPEGEPPRFLLVWTTTPWTLPANLLIAAREDLDYVIVREPDGSESVLSARAFERYYPGRSPDVTEHLRGDALRDWSYEPLFPYAGAGSHRYRIVLDPMVEDQEGTGFVHIAPSFGPDDQRVGEREGVGRFDPLDSRGVFTDAVPPVAGKSFKAADRALLEELTSKGAVVRSETIRHTYPFCWRCKTPLIYRALDSWFVRVSRFSKDLVENNRQVRWIPAYLRDGRFGNFLEEAKDWALSRNRYWGTPLPVWMCDKGHPTCIGSFAELAERSGEALPAPFDPHRVTVDRITVRCATCGNPARREPYTIDAWYDSGSAPFAQYHYPFAEGPFSVTEPLDYVAEGLDQTRGWFYSLLVLATGLFHRPAYKACLTNGLALDERGLKMSKSLGNVLEPLRLLEAHGGDAVRWTFLTVDYTEPMRLDESAFRLAGGRTLATVVHLTEFWKQNALPGHLPAVTAPPSPKAALDRWLLSRVTGTFEEVGQALDSLDLRRGALALATVIDEMSTWYLRRSRPRFWTDEVSEDRQEANATLSYSLGVVAHLLAPYAPFTAEYVYQELSSPGYSRPESSIHAQPWPASVATRDLRLEVAMAKVREYAELGRELRQRAGVKSRVPLPEFIITTPTDQSSVDPALLKLLADELNVRSVRTAEPAEMVRLPETDWVVRTENDRAVAALSRRPTPELMREGQVREVLRRLQQLRKQLGLAYTERVDLDLFASPTYLAALQPAAERIRAEVLVDRLRLGPSPAPSGGGLYRFDLEGEPLEVDMRRARPVSS